ncbi:MAG: lytic transglycosylase domain-containing protein [Bacteroidales bacterium]|nr:lytic transglycosylase domain-containing protein [Bacteroidales bacterium]
MKTRDLLIACGMVIILIGVTAAITFSIAQNTNEEDKKAYYESLNPDILYYDHLDQNIHDIALPDSLEFCGEYVPMDRFYVRESLERELLVNAHLHSSTMLLLKRTSRWFPIIEPIMQKNGLPEDFKYLAMIESALTNAVSPSKAVGFWQFLEGTGKDYNLEINKEVDMRYNQELETVAACKYLKESYRKFGSWITAAAAFNCGNGRISKTIEEQKVTSYFDMLLPNETERYVYRILALKLITEDPAKYGFHISDEGWYQPLQFKTLTVTESIPDLIEFALNNGTNLKMLKYYNPWLRGNSLTISEGNSYKIKIPK